MSDYAVFALEEVIDRAIEKGYATLGEAFDDLAADAWACASENGPIGQWVRYAEFYRKGEGL